LSPSSTVTGRLMRMNFFAAFCSSIPALDQENEGPRTAVHDRHFAGTDVHVGVVDAQPRHGGQQVLHRGYATAVVHQGRRECRVADVCRAWPGSPPPGRDPYARNTIPLSTGAGARVRYTFSPVCRPTPVALMALRNVRCRIIQPPCHRLRSAAGPVSVSPAPFFRGIRTRRPLDSGPDPAPAQTRGSVSLAAQKGGDVEIILAELLCRRRSCTPPCRAPTTRVAPAACRREP
jgi:hypothetical protein